MDNITTTTNEPITIHANASLLELFTVLQERGVAALVHRDTVLVVQVVRTADAHATVEIEIEVQG